MKAWIDHLGSGLGNCVDDLDRGEAAGDTGGESGK